MTCRLTTVLGLFENCQQNNKTMKIVEVMDLVYLGKDGCGGH